MSFRALATDYDGTIAHDGVVDDGTIAALERARAAGLRLLLVTGRELPDLFNTFPAPHLFDRIVAENGAVLYDPRDRRVHPLAPSPPPALLDALTRRKVPISVGHAIVATVMPHLDPVLEAIHEAGLPWHVILNKGAVMVLPSGVTKSTGLGPALQAIGVSAEETIAVGDAENDLAFLQQCGFAVAVSNALPEVKVIADLVTEGARGTGVAELIDLFLRGELQTRAGATHRS